MLNKFISFIEFMEGITSDLDSGNSLDLVYLDFEKAFDKVPYRRLSKKVEAHGIGGFVLQWIENWLSSRRQRVGINGVYSLWREVTSGVPQGSVLGPILFVIYINDLDSDLVSKIGKFADDTKMYKNVNCTEDAEILRNDLSVLDEWSKKWQMQLNVEKCVVMHMGRKRSKMSVC